MQLQLMPMTINIIAYNHLMEKYGIKLLYIGFTFLFVNAIPVIWQNMGMIIVVIALILIITSIALVNYSTRRIEVIGKISIGDDSTQIQIKDLVTVLANKEYHSKLSEACYEGRNNYIPFLTIGSFTSHTGITDIFFYNDQKFFKYKIKISSKAELNVITSTIKNHFSLP
jgi:hypothetical protein